MHQTAQEAGLSFWVAAQSTMRLRAAVNGDKHKAVLPDLFRKRDRTSMLTHLASIFSPVICEAAVL